MCCGGSIRRSASRHYDSPKAKAKREQRKEEAMTKKHKVHVKEKASVKLPGAYYGNPIITKPVKEPHKHEEVDPEIPDEEDLDPIIVDDEDPIL